MVQSQDAATIRGAVLNTEWWDLLAELQELHQKYAFEQDAGKKLELLEQMFALIEKGLEELFVSLSNEENPQLASMLIAEFNRASELINRVLDLRGRVKQDTPQTK